MLAMANQAYLSVWTKDFTEERMLKDFTKFLGTVPFSAAKPGFAYLIVRAVDARESPMLEQDLRAVPLDAFGIAELAKDYLHRDSAYEVHCYWDLWAFGEDGRWKPEPQPLEILFHGEEYDEGYWREGGHIRVDLGFEHFFTGHAGLLGMRRGERAPAQSREEAQFLEAMAWPENLQRYQEKTRENIRKLLDWVKLIERAVPVERVRLWSEGEENFEARVEEILVAH
jgi:hypothetical protein